MKKRSSEELQQIRRELRKDMTYAEKIFWIALRGRHFSNLKFRRQHPLFGRFIVDFFCPAKKLVIELDGSVHEGREEVDADRQAIIEANWIKVIRFKNEEVLNDIDRVMEALTLALSR
jgi:very-short-patch-repair endonuclease